MRMKYGLMSAKRALREVCWFGVPEDCLETHSSLSMPQDLGLWISQMRSPKESVRDQLQSVHPGLPSIEIQRKQGRKERTGVCLSHIQVRS